MNVVLINVPSRKGEGGSIIPLGLMYVAGILKRSGYGVTIVDPYIFDPQLDDFDKGNFNEIDRIIREKDAVIVGYSGIATSFGRLKKLSSHIKGKFPSVLHIAGGAIASVSDLVLKNTCVDVVFKGEAEQSIPLFLEQFSVDKSWGFIPGISFRQNNSVKNNPLSEQVEDLDNIPMPDYDSVDIHKHMFDLKAWLLNNAQVLKDCGAYDDIRARVVKAKGCLPLITSRGCLYKCFFCYRHMRGVRQNSVAYVIRHLKFLMNKYDINGFQFIDELFNSNPDWVLEFCDALERERLDITYLVSGARIDRVNERLLRRLKETGCIEVSYGQESGSDTILKEYRKGVTRKLNLEMTILTKKVGLNCPVQIVIGSPSETNATINETIDFLKSAEAYKFSMNYLIPLPETPSWQYAQDNKLIADTEKYLDAAARFGGTIPLVNLTKAHFISWRRWGFRIRKELKLHHCSKTNRRSYLIYKTLFTIFNDPILFEALIKVKGIFSRVKDFLLRFSRKNVGRVESLS